MDINISIEKRFAGCLDIKWLRMVVERVLAAQRVDTAAEISVIITGQKQIHRLNKAYLGEDRPTDVLSFPMLEPPAKAIFVAAPDGKTHLGEIIVSFPQAVLKADENGHPVEREVAALITHGTLHLLGYDHAETAEKKKMQKREKEIMSSIAGIEQ